MTRKTTHSWPVMIILGIGALCTSAQTAQRYFFAPRVTALTRGECTAGDDLCYVSYPGHDSVKIEGDVPQALDAGRPVRIYEAGDDYHARLAEAGPPWQVWLLAALALAYLALLVHSVRRATVARGEGSTTFVAGELGILSWALGLPVIIAGALLAFSPHSLVPGLLTLTAGWAVLIGAFTAFILINRHAARTATPQSSTPTP